MADPPIGIYPHLTPVACRDYDPRAPLVAERVMALVREQLPTASIEHIGSTAVPGCAGKGVVDLMIVYRDADELAAAKDALAALGFGRQRGRNPWPEDRPMRIGTLHHDSDTFLLHVHVIPASSPQVAEQRAFRDRLRADPALVAAYVARKRAILAGGTTDGLDYSLAKGDFIEAVLAEEKRRENGEDMAEGGEGSGPISR